MISMESSGRLAEASDLSVREAEASCKGKVVSQIQLPICRLYSTHLQHRQKSFSSLRTLAIDNHMRVCTIDIGIVPVYSTTAASVCI
jgi:hypothetical protein